MLRVQQLEALAAVVLAMLVVCIGVGGDGGREQADGE
jgi:hypothetical protein